MKSVMKEGAVGPKFPKLMISTDGKTVIFATKNCEGMVIYEEEPCSAVHVGKFCTVWEMSQFVDFNGEVTLSN